jgi:hypothetical protein
MKKWQFATIRNGRNPVYSPWPVAAILKDDKKSQYPTSKHNNKKLEVLTLHCQN